MGSELAQPGTCGVARAIALTVLLLIVPMGHAGYQTVPAGQNSDPGSFRISVDVPLVVLHATVTDRQGSLVTSLGEQDFQVYENGVRQQIRLFKNEDVPVTVGLVIDHSGTMAPKIVQVTTAARVFARASNPEDEIFVVNFHEVVSLGLPAGVRFTHDAGELQEAIIAARTTGQTALYDAVAMALEQLRTGSRDKKVLVVISDGGDNASKRNLDQVMKLAGQSGAVIYTVGLFDEGDPDRNPGVLQRLALETGGAAFLPEEIHEVVAVCERIARDVRHQYTIGYAPDNPANDGSYRAIRVVAGARGHGKFSVRTRSGYMAGGEPKHGEKAVR